MLFFRELTALVLTTGVLVATVGQASAEKRVALVIGNDDYQSLPDLRNARKDARDIAAKLESLGFETTIKLDASHREFRRALAEFSSRLVADGVGLVFYAGHGIQNDGHNYLIPADAHLEMDADLLAEAVDARDVLETMERAGNPLNIVILDACRDNPLPRRTRSATRGLTVVGIPPKARGMAVLYSAGEGQVAQDGEPGGNGVFTGELVKAMDEPGLTLEQVFKHVSRRVLERTDGAQRPWNLSSLQGDFYFRPGPREAGGVKEESTESVFWRAIEGSTNAADFQTYLRQFPGGAHVATARARASRLSTSAPPVAPLEQRMWVTGDQAVNVRAEPSAEAARVGRLAGHGEIMVTGKVEGANWYQVALPGGERGYVHDSLLKLDSSTSAPPSSMPPPASPSGDALTAEMMFWISAQNSNDANMINDYMRKYPAGHFVELAKTKLRELKDRRTEDTQRGRQDQERSKTATAPQWGNGPVVPPYSGARLSSRESAARDRMLRQVGDRLGGESGE